MKRSLLILATGLWCLLASSGRTIAQTPSPTPTPTQSSNAEEPDFIVPSRPTVSNPAEFQRPGVLQLEFGFSSNFRGPEKASEEDFPLALRFAVSPRVLLELDLDGPLSQKISGVRETGVGDTLIGIQTVLQHEKDTRPGIAAAYYIKIPTASETKGLGTSRVDHNLIGFISKKIGQTTVDFNAIYLLAGRTTSNGHASSVQGALAASRNVTRRFGIQGEISGLSRSDAQPGALFVLAAVTYQVDRRLVLDSGVRFGLIRDAPRLGAFAGMTVGIADFYRRRH